MMVSMRPGFLVRVIFCSGLRGQVGDIEVALDATGMFTLMMVQGMLIFTAAV
jgi:hypothetical protein